jgi:hypothetical protein
VDSDSIVVTFTSLKAGVFADTCSIRIVDPAQVVTISLKATCVAGVSVVRAQWILEGDAGRFSKR